MNMVAQSGLRFSVDQAAQHVGISSSTLNKLRIFGGGPAFLKLGRRVVYDANALNSWMASKQRRCTSDRGEAA